ncbi:MAG: hypothetical protein JSR46_09595, partial [Verrucomicrobia bacterium]|nr:hypothetical protein [Verrucomicrobiota bacterium]
LEIFFKHYQLKLDRSQQASLQLLKRHIHEQRDEAQVLSLSGSEDVLKRCQSILATSDAKLILLAAFSPELELLQDEVKTIHNAGRDLNVLSFGRKPNWLESASEHLSEQLIEKAQGGRLLMVTAFPQSLIAVIRSDGTASGIWAWNRYLAAAIGLYISHEILIIKMWPLIDEKTQKHILSTLPDLSSKIALAGVTSGLPLDAYVSGVLTPQFYGEDNGSTV